MGTVEKGHQPGTQCSRNAMGGSLLEGLNVFTRCIGKSNGYQVRLALLAACGLAWDKARLGAPGLGG